MRLAYLPVVPLVLASIIPTACLAYSSCEAPKDADVGSCLSLTDYDLNSAYEKLMSPIAALLDEHERKALKEDEREWVIRRNKECELSTGEALNTASIVDGKKARCVIQLTVARIALFERRAKSKESEVSKERASDNRTYTSPEIPQRGKSLIDFVPAGYLIFEKVEADFNGDGLKDVAVVLSPTASRQYDPRPLLLLLARREGGYVLSARNDNLAITYGTGGIANPTGVGILKTKGRSLLVQSLSGGSGAYSGDISEFRFMGDGWYLVSETESANNRDGDAEAGVCDSDAAINVPPGWKCTETSTKADFRTGNIIESWTLEEKNGDQSRTKRVKRHTAPGPLKRFEDIQ